MNTPEPIAFAIPALTLTVHDFHAPDYRLMADSTRPWLIPKQFNSPRCLIAWYGDGLYKWTKRQLARFPSASKVQITVFGDPDADVADVETGDMAPADFPSWLRARIAAGKQYHALYCSLDTKPLVDDAVRGAGMNVRDYGWWAAHPTGEPHRVPGALATQYAWLGGYDLSAVYAPDWHPAA